MSKIIVTREFDTIADAIAFLQGTTSGVVAAITHQTNPAATTTDDDSGPANANAPATDAAGLPWDERIHSAKKALNTDNTWRKRRGVQDAFVAQIENELRSRGAQQAGMYMPTTQPGPQMMQQPAPNMPSPGPQMMQPQYQPGPQMQPGPGPTQMQPGPGPTQMQPPQQYQQQPQPGPAPGMDFNAFMSHVMQKMQQRDPQTQQPLIEHNYLLTVVQKLNSAFNRQYQAITDIGTDPAVISYAQQIIAADGRW